ncbi:MAG: putative Ig domain-containing protein [Candidatus Latescibacteria bacterium]|nr:putative Ig domain-containing protein [Candidatus Latescibacterota bacterium]
MGADDEDGSSIPMSFAKQIAIEPDYILSVNPSSVREDAGGTDIEIKVKVGDDTAVEQNTSVPLLMGTNQTGLNTRFGISFPPLVITEGEKEATGMIRFTPIESDTPPHDDLLVTIRTVGGIAGATDIRLVDTDKASTAISLSFSDATITKNDGTTEIEVTATLDGKTLDDHVSFDLVIDNAAPGSARRDVDYTATLRPITIRRRQVSGKATITITPLNEGVGAIRVAPSNAMNTRTPAISIPVNPSSIEITAGPEAGIKGLTALPFSIREDSETKNVRLEISLQNALLTDETVVFTISDTDEDIRELQGRSDIGDRFQLADDADRDVDYRAQVQALVIPKGETTATTTMTVTPINNNREDGLRAFKVTALVGGKTYSEGILITDDDTISDSITLEVSPAEINESDGVTSVTVTGILNGKVFKDNVIVPLVINDDINGDGTVNADDKAATRDLDYTASLSPLVIPGGQTQGTATITITPTANDGKEGDEKIGLKSSGEPEARDEDGVTEKLVVVGTAITLKDVHAEGTQPTPADPTRPTFAVADSIASQSYAVGTAIDPLVLPEASGGAAPLTYSLSTLPAGLSFDAATRTLSGTPTAETNGAATIIYTVIDSARAAGVLIFTITVEEGEMPPPVADAQLSVTPSAIREDAGLTQVSLTVSLSEAKAADEIVTFTIVAPSEGKQAVRDVDYTASLGAIIAIPAGSTVGTGTLTLTPINNVFVDSLRAIGVQATFASGATLMTDIKIVDDETPSTSIELSVDPHTIIEGSGNVEVTVTATLDGKALAENATVVVAIDAASTATRDVDYAALFNPLIAIPAGSITGSTQFVIRIIDDDLAEGSETIKLIGVINGLMGDEAEITLSDQAPTPPPPPDPPDPGALAFADNTAIPNQAYTAGTAITPLVLPAASGGTAPLTYSISVLPTGLVFDPATRTISGTPATVDSTVTVIVIYTVIDSAGSAVALTFSITINPGISIGFDDLFNFFGAGKIVPTDSHDLAVIREFVVGQRVEGIVLPEASGGTAPLTYTLSPALPVGLMFDASTRTISGTPSSAAETVYTYTVTDANGATASLALQTLPTAFALADNFPNPFNPATTIQYALPTAADVELTVYNVVGQPVRTLVAEHQSAGRYMVEWDATDDSGHSLSSGMYFYRLQAGEEFREVKKMLLLK